MPLEKFIPLSPDPYITQDSDMKLAQFGHLNTIVDYLNTYVVADSLQLEGVGPLSATARYITDSAGNLSSLAISTGNIGIGTTTPIGILHLYKSATTTRLAIDGDAGQNRLISYRTGAVQRFGLYVNNTAESGSNAGSDFAIRAYNDAGTLLSTPFFINRASGNVGIGTTNPFSLLTVGGQSNFYSIQSAGAGTDFFYSDINPNITAGANNQIVSLLRLRDRGWANTGGFTGTQRLSLILENSGGSQFPFQLFSESGALRIGYSSIATPTAKVEIKGSGSTSATTSLLVQNSGTTRSLQVLDDGTTIVGQPTFGVKIGQQTITSTQWATVSGDSVTFPTTTQYGFFVSSNGNGSGLNAGQEVELRTGGVKRFVVTGATGNIIIQNGGTFTEITSARLQVTSTTQGFLPPRMTTAQKNLIATPAIGLQIFDTDLNRPCFYNGAWVTL